MIVRWTPEAAASARRFMRDQQGMRKIVSAVEALADNPEPEDGFHRGRYHRLRVDAYRVIYFTGPAGVVIYRIDRVAEV
jgi:mRNA-degrading endonuclease RelE of RelBE toxin-antitoxin system